VTGARDPAHRLEGVMRGAGRTAAVTPDRASMFLADVNAAHLVEDGGQPNIA